jgi:hypothetical protein
MTRTRSIQANPSQHGHRKCGNARPPALCDAQPRQHGGGRRTHGRVGVRQAGHQPRRARVLRPAGGAPGHELSVLRTQHRAPVQRDGALLPLRLLLQIPDGLAQHARLLRRVLGVQLGEELRQREGGLPHRDRALHAVEQRLEPPPPRPPPVLQQQRLQLTVRTQPLRNLRAAAQHRLPRLTISWMVRPLPLPQRAEGAQPRPLRARAAAAEGTAESLGRDDAGERGRGHVDAELHATVHPGGHHRVEFRAVGQHYRERIAGPPILRAHHHHLTQVAGVRGHSRPPRLRLRLRRCSSSHLSASPSAQPLRPAP